MAHFGQDLSHWSVRRGLPRQFVAAGLSSWPPRDRLVAAGMSANAIIWLRRDLRLGDHPALQATLAAKQRPLFVYIDDPAGEGAWPLGAASRAWLRHSLRALDKELGQCGSRLILRAGDSLQVLQELCAESGAEHVVWNRRYEPAARERDSALSTLVYAAALTITLGRTRRNTAMTASRSVKSPPVGSASFLPNATNSPSGRSDRWSSQPIRPSLPNSSIFKAVSCQKPDSARR